MSLLTTGCTELKTKPGYIAGRANQAGGVITQALGMQKMQFTLLKMLSSIVEI